MLCDVQMLELVFESFDLPAAYLCHNATLASFASGRPTSLVVDMGASATRCVPVVDGYALHRSTVATRRGGMYLDQVFAEALHIDFSAVSADKAAGDTKKRRRDNGGKRAAPGASRVLTPWYESAGTLSTAPGAGVSPADVSASFRNMHCSDTLRDMRHWMCFVPPSRELAVLTPSSQLASSTAHEYNLAGIIASIPPYELPDGTAVHPCSEATLVTDQHLFNPVFASALKKSSRTVHSLLTHNDSSNGKKPLHSGEYDLHFDDEADLAGLVLQAVLKADVDARKELLSNVLVVGGGALTDGVAPRLQSDLSSLLPSHAKVQDKCPSCD